MKYMVMECHPAYAVVLDEEGQFRTYYLPKGLPT